MAAVDGAGSEVTPMDTSVDTSPSAVVGNVQMERPPQPEISPVWRTHVPYLYDVFMATEIDATARCVHCLPTTSTSGPGHRYMTVKATPTPNVDILEVKRYVYDQEELLTERDAAISVHGPAARIETMPGFDRVVAVKTMDERVHIFSYDSGVDRSVSAGRPPPSAIRLVTDPVEVPAGALVAGTTGKPQGTSPSVTSSPAKPVTPGSSAAQLVAGAIPANGGGNGIPPYRLANGSGMGFSKQGTNMFATGTKDLLLWDLTVYSKRRGSVDLTPCAEPVRRFAAHTRPLQDCAWATLTPSLIASVGSDERLLVFDTRVGTGGDIGKHVLAVNVSGAPLDLDEDAEPVTCVDWSPLDDILVATGGIDGRLCLWDTRKPQLPVKMVSAHNTELKRVSFHPSKRGIVATVGASTISLWDLQRPTMPTQDGKPHELLFNHGGHIDPVLDISWGSGSDMEWGMVSIDKANRMQVWNVTSDVAIEWGGGTDPLHPSIMPARTNLFGKGFEFGSPWTPPPAAPT